jgi:hypothetical protein
MPTPAGGMTHAELGAYAAKRAREQPERDRLTRRYHAATGWLESNCNSLSHWRRFVEHVEQLIAAFRREERAQALFDGSAFMRELCAEDPVLWAAYLAMATRATEGQP